MTDKPFEIVIVRGGMLERRTFRLMSEAFIEARRLELDGWEVVFWPRLTNTQEVAA